MTAPRPDAEQTPAPQLPPWLRHPRGPFGWAGLTLLVVAVSVVLLAMGLVVVAVAIVAWVVRGAVWIVLSVVDWVWFIARGYSRRPYPYVLRPPLHRDSRALVFNDAWVSSLPRVIGLVARTAGFLFAPLALFASLAGIVVPRLRARPYIAVFNVPGLEAKLVGIGRNHGYFDDGHDVTVEPYDTFLREAFPQRADFLQWWRDPKAVGTFRPAAASWNTPRHFSGLTLGPFPDVLGLPGLALVSMRRTRIDGLRELFISQREIDDLGDPDLDDRAEVAVIRVVSIDDDGATSAADGVVGAMADANSAADVAAADAGETDARPGRRWIVQFPSTQTWHPRSGRAPNDLTADLVALSMQETTLTRAAVQAMRQAGIRTGEPVFLAGFSLGGMIATQVADLAAREGFTVTHLVTAGSSIGRYRLPDTIRVLSLEHILDAVPRLEGRENPVVVERAPQERAPSRGAQPGPVDPASRTPQDAAEWLTVKAGPPLPRGYRVAATHHSPSYAETAGAIETDPPAAPVATYVDGLRPFFAGDQVISDFAAQREGFDAVRPAVPISIRSSTYDDATRERLRTTLRRVPGVIAVDIYQSRTGFPTTVLWSADVLVHSLRPWFQEVARASAYRALLTLFRADRSIGLHLRLQAKRTPGVTWESTMQRMADGRWRERVDVGFDSEAARAEWSDLLLPGGWASRVTYYDASAFE
jgi:hypothetical protein